MKLIKVALILMLSASVQTQASSTQATCTDNTLISIHTVFDYRLDQMIDEITQVERMIKAFKQKQLADLRAGMSRDDYQKSQRQLAALYSKRHCLIEASNDATMRALWNDI